MNDSIRGVEVVDRARRSVHAHTHAQVLDVSGVIHIQSLDGGVAPDIQRGCIDGAAGDGRVWSFELNYRTRMRPVVSNIDDFCPGRVRRQQTANCTQGVNLRLQIAIGCDTSVCFSGQSALQSTYRSAENIIRILTDVLFIHQTFVEQTVRLTQGGCSGDVRGNTGRVRRVRSVCIETSACLSRVQLRLQGSLSSESTSFFGIHICNPCSFFSIHVRDPCSLFSVYVRDASRDFVVDGGLQCGFGAFSAQLLCVYICDTCSFLSIHISNPCSFLSIHICNAVSNLLRDLRLEVCFNAFSTRLLRIHIQDASSLFGINVCDTCRLFRVHIQDASSFFGIDVRNAVRDFCSDL